MMITLATATRNRPNNMDRFITSASLMANQKDKLEFFFYIDDDDKASIDKYNSIDDERVLAIIGPRIVLTQAVNQLGMEANGDIVAYSCDEMIFRTAGWDDIIRAEFEKVPDKILLVHGYDGLQAKGGLATTGFIHKNWINTLGYFMPAHFSCDWGDSWVTDIANMLGRKVFVDVYIEHMHFVNRKGPRDKTHQERMARGGRDNVNEIYRKTLNERLEAVEKLKKFIEEYNGK